MAFFSGNKQTGDENETAKNSILFQLIEKNILVTGANGQLGSEIRRATEKHEKNLHFFFTDVDSLDITNLEALDSFVKENSIQYIINCAAYTAVDKAEDDIELCFKINRDAVVNLATAASNNGAKVIHISTDYVFNGSNTKPYKETDNINPQSVYGRSKQEGEEQLLRICPQAIIIRTAWLYSIYGNNFVKTMLKLGNERDTLNVVADQRGTPTNAADLAKAIVHILDWSEVNHFESGIYHYTNEGETSWYDFTVEIHKAAAITTCLVSPIQSASYPTRALRPQYSVLDKQKIKNTFMLSIPQWQDSLKICIKELLAN